jgi:hypothetical protein
VTLSVCCLTADPGPRVAAALRGLRPVADEIVVAADARADGDRLAAYASVADRVLRVEFAYTERHLAWLHAQCRGDWILRIDGDEVASPRLVELLPRLLTERVHQYLLPRRWLFPDAGHWLNELPWWPDYQVRLVRNDGLLRFPGLDHTSAVPVRPARYLEEPLYHFALLGSSQEERRGKAAWYESRRPGLKAHGGGALNERFYLPELHARRTPVPVEEGDRAAIDEAVGGPLGGPKAQVDPDGLPVVPLAESDRFWAGRPLGAEAYRAEIDQIEPEYRMAVGERRALHFRIANRGNERWPWDSGIGPRINASYHWLRGDGTPAVDEGLRTAFPCDIAPGETVIVPLDVLAPDAPGDYLLEVDLVHEDVRWFDCGTRVHVPVTERLGASLA